MADEPSAPAGPAGTDESHRAEWDRLCAAFDMAKADFESSGDHDTEESFYLGALCQAERALLTARVPDVAGLLRKLELFRDQRAWEEHDWDAWLNAAIEDARRLAG